MPFPTGEEEAYDRLHRAGWSPRIYTLAGLDWIVCVVEGLNGKNLIRGETETVWIVRAFPLRLST
jgi:hypothetical protein